MRRALLWCAAVLFFAALDVSAQCVECYIDPWTECASCVPTNYNASVLCTIIHNGYGCKLDGGCEGTEGECRDPQHPTQLRPLELKFPAREWQLVSVEIVRPRTAVPERKRRS